MCSKLSVYSDIDKILNRISMVSSTFIPTLHRASYIQVSISLLANLVPIIFVVCRRCASPCCLLPSTSGRRVEPGRQQQQRQESLRCFLSFFSAFFGRRSRGRPFSFWSSASAEPLDDVLCRLVRPSGSPVCTNSGCAPAGLF